MSPQPILEHSFDDIRRALQPAADAIATEVDVVTQITSIEPTPALAIPTEPLVVQRSDPTTTSTSSSCTGSSSQCNELPSDSSSLALPIALAISIPAVGAAGVLLYLHRRSVKKQREEDARDPHKSLDFGLGDVPSRQGGKGGEMGEKSGRSARQLSLEMNMTSPYLLPPELHSSRESLHSLSRTIHNQEDPYRPVTLYHGRDSASIRSSPRTRQDTASTYTSSSRAPSRLQDLSRADLLSNAADMPRSTPPSAQFSRPPRNGSLAPEKPLNMSPVDASSPQLPPPAVLKKDVPPASNRLGPDAAPVDRDSYNPVDLRHSNNYLGAIINTEPMSLNNQPYPQSPEILTMPELPEIRTSPPPVEMPAESARPKRNDSLPASPLVAPTATHPPAKALIGGGSDLAAGFEVTPPSPELEPSRGRPLSRGPRTSSVYASEVDGPTAQTLDAPAPDVRRLSMGFRPLPPDSTLEVDDPEVRANRIRSFYKEYFDDSKPAPVDGYYEDYDQNFLPDATFYDPHSNNFVMPYAQPVTRRAMTPPPRGAPRGPAHMMHGSMGGMGPRGPGLRGPMMPVAGRPRMASPGPRSYSSASGRMPAPRKKLPPPVDLTTLPTPSKLKDDAFMIMNPLDFAPPTTFRDRQAGRSESPLGERRPYSPVVPAHNPLVSAFDDLASIPSPHLLRKSSTFTALDFAPPRKFKDPDTMSDAGSIRSNRSGVSAVQLGAIRSGAYRISRLPQDMVGTKDDLMASLKPQWGMRPSEA